MFQRAAQIQRREDHAVAVILDQNIHGAPRWRTRPIDQDNAFDDKPFKRPDPFVGASVWGWNQTLRIRVTAMGRQDSNQGRKYKYGE